MPRPDRSRDVLRKILQNGLQETSRPEELVSEVFKKNPSKTVRPKAPGRPKVSDKMKAKNFTLCLAPRYLSFLDRMKVHDPKVKGRGRKVRFIIDQFLELHRRQETQLQVMKKALSELKAQLEAHSAASKQRLLLSPKEKTQISKLVRQVLILLKVQGFRPKEMQRLLTSEEARLISFCLSWGRMP